MEKQTSPTEETFEASIINKKIIDNDVDGVPPAGDEKEVTTTSADAAAAATATTTTETANAGEDFSNDKKRESPEPVPHDVPEAKRIQLVVEADEEEVAATNVAANEVAESVASAMEKYSESSTSVSAPAAAIKVAVYAWDLHSTSRVVTMTS